MLWHKIAILRRKMLQFPQDSFLYHNIIRFYIVQKILWDKRKREKDIS